MRSVQRPNWPPPGGHASPQANGPLPMHRAPRHAPRPRPATRPLTRRRSALPREPRGARSPSATGGHRSTRPPPRRSRGDRRPPPSGLRRARPIHRREAGRAFERSAVDGDESKRRKELLSGRDEALARAASRRGSTTSSSLDHQASRRASVAQIAATSGSASRTRPSADVSMCRARPSVRTKPIGGQQPIGRTGGMTRSAGKVLIDDSEEPRRCGRRAVLGSSHHDLVVDEIISVDYDANLVARIEPECRALTHHDEVSHGRIRVRERQVAPHRLRKP